MILRIVLFVLLPARFVAFSTGTACDQLFKHYEKNGFCYRLYNNHLNYYDAIKFCQEHGAELASIHDEFENAFISSLGSNDTLIGLRYSESINDYIWSDGTSLDYKSYASGFENGKDLLGYCALQHGEEWRNADCDIDAEKFVCKKKATTYTSTAADVCQKNVNYTNGGMFVSPGYPNFTAAGLSCRYKLLARDGYLIKIFLDENSEICQQHYFYITREYDEKRVIFDLFRTEAGGYEFVLPTNRVSMDFSSLGNGPWRFSWSEVKDEIVAVPSNERIKLGSSSSNEVTFCNLGYRLYEGKCYRNFNDIKLNFYDAFARCRSTGGNLATIHDPRTDAFLQSLVSDGQTFIGLRYANGTLQWLDGSQIDYTNYAYDFSTTQHSNGYCTQIKDEQWKHAECTERLNFICESNALKLTPTANNVCPDGNQIHKDYGVLFSPGYPINMSINIPRCLYRLSVKEGNFIRLFVDEMEVWAFSIYFYDADGNEIAFAGIWGDSSGSEIIVPHSRFVMHSLMNSGRWKISFEGIERP